MSTIGFISHFVDAHRTKRALWRRIQRRRDAFENRFTFLFRQVLNKQYNELADRITADNVSSKSLLSNIKQEPIEKALTELYKTVGSSFAQNEYNEIKGIEENWLHKADDEWYAIMVNQIKRRLWKRIESIHETTVEYAGRIINQELEESVAEGLGAAETASKVRKGLLSKGIELNQWRALRIARTEIMSASNVGSLIGAKATGEDLEKWWLATYDERTRDTHRVVEEQNPKNFDEGFRVGAYLMEAPGGSRRRAGGGYKLQVCHCI